MYLKKMEMRGFKSFAEHTFIDFEGGLTCVVGPNGSGKSNITDAARWVLGEQKIKTLRGSKMEDVIFNGTKHRKPLGMAEVKMIFDNSDNFFDIDYNEVTISRRMYRSGESEYKINDMPCRLKDIREILMDTGIGREGYSIIGQGKIDEILSHSKDERRKIFEEASGIVKYKSRKNESLKKLDNTQNNLTRIEDIIFELSDRIQPLEKEAKKAKAYMALDEQLKHIELSYFANRYETCDLKCAKIESEKNQFSTNRDSFENQKQLLLSQKKEISETIEKINLDIHNQEEYLHQLDNSKQKQIGEKEILSEKLKHKMSNFERLEQSVTNFESTQMTMHDNVESIEKEIETIKKDYVACQNNCEETEKALEEKEHHFNKVMSQHEEKRHQVIQKMNEIEVKKSDIQSAENFNKNIIQRVETINHDIASYKENLAKVDAHIEEASNQVKTHENQLEDENAKLSAMVKENMSLKSELDDLIDLIAHGKERLSKEQAEYNLLKQLEREYDGFDKGVKEVLKLLDKNPNYSKGMVGTVASLMTVPQKYEKSIEVALGKSIQNIVCEEVSGAKKIIEYLKQNKLGRVTFLPLDNILGKGDQKDKIHQLTKMNGFLGKANELIDFDGKYNILFDYLLGRIVIADNFESAQKMLKIKGLKYKIITLDGEILIPGGTISGGHYQSKVSNVIGRKRKIETLEIDINQHKKELDEILGRQEIVKSELNQISGTLNDLYSKIDQVKKDKQEAQKSLEINQHNRETCLNSIEKNTANLSVLREELDISQKDIEKAESFIAINEAQIDEFKSQMNQQSINIEELEKTIDYFKSVITSVKIDIAGHEQKLEFKNQELNRFKNECEEMLSKKDSIDREMIHLQHDIEKNKKELEAIEAEINASIGSYSGEKEKLTDLRKRVVEYQEKAIMNQQSSDDLFQSIQMENESLHKLEIQSAKLEVEKEAIISELWDKYEKSIAEIFSIERIEVKKSEITSIKSQMKKIGEVNLASVKEYDEVSERYQFLNQQKEDLLASKKDLEKVLRELDKQMEKMFRNKFEEISSNFKETFSTLFGGGDADLVITDQDNILDCEIEIIAQPPGKKLQSINLLSGGEKALTAIALLFAILKTKPSPFCILDEIEAALDDVNVYRFANFIEMYSRRSQFIIITHRKGTMEIAENLYGVTMEEYGVSKVVSVKLESYQEEVS